MFNKSIYPCIVITKEMIRKANDLIPNTKVNRTIASEIDTLTGNLGEFVFAQYYYGDWKINRVGENKGEINFGNIEIKTSSFPFNLKLNLLVREDYARKRKAPYYIQIIIDVANSKATEIMPNTKAYICGYATAKDIDKAPLKDFGSKFGNAGGYKCHYIGIVNLKPMEDFCEIHKKK